MRRLLRGDDLDDLVPQRPEVDPLEESFAAAAALRGRSSAAGMPPVTKWKVGPPAISMSGRGWCVRMKTGA